MTLTFGPFVFFEPIMMRNVSSVQRVSINAHRMIGGVINIICALMATRWTEETLRIIMGSKKTNGPNVSVIDLPKTKNGEKAGELAGYADGQ